MLDKLDLNSTLGQNGIKDFDVVIAVAPDEEHYRPFLEYYWTHYANCFYLKIRNKDEPHHLLFTIQVSRRESYPCLQARINYLAMSVGLIATPALFHLYRQGYDYLFHQHTSAPLTNLVVLTGYPQRSHGSLQQSLSHKSFTHKKNPSMCYS